MKIMLDFYCQKCDDHIEALVERGSSKDCKKCGSPMKQMPSAVGLLRTNFHDGPSVKQR